MAKKTKKPRTFRVWFNQINQDYIDVEARDHAEAEKKATKVWLSDYAIPEIPDSKELKED